jgi:cytochrome c oxidase subunit 2
VPFRSAFDQLFTQNSIIAGVVFALVVAAMAVAMVLSWRRKRRRLGPSQRAEATRVELSYIAALTGMAIFLVIASFSANAKDFPDPPQPAVRVLVTGYQWCWRFHYEGTPVTTTGQCQGYQSLPVLVVPVGEPVRLDMTSVDVIHGVWVPYWRLKLYAYPGRVESLTVTITRTGSWIGRCAQLCGLYHYEMDFTVRAVSPAAFKAFMSTGKL